MAAMTLVEAAKLYGEDPVRQAVIEAYYGSSSVLRVLPFENIMGNALRYNREDTLPGVGFRGVNEGYAESVGIINPVTESLYIAGGDLDVDNFIIKTQGEDSRSTHEALKIKALALMWTKVFFKGDSVTDPREFDGLQVRLTGGQVIDAGNTSGGDALSLAKMDELIDQVEGDNKVLFMSKVMARLITQAARDSSLHNVTFDIEEFGRRVMRYDGIPIETVDLDNTGSAILPFTEANPGGGTAASTSIYCTALGDGHLTGIQNGDIDATDLGELQTKPARRTRVEWYSGLAAYHGRSAARLRGIKQAAVTK